MKRVVLIVLAVITLLIAVPLLICGAVLTAIGSGDDPTVHGRIGQVDSDGYAVVSDTLEVHWDYPFADRFDLTVGAQNVRSDAPIFIGYGPTADVDAYLSGVPQTIVYGLGYESRSEREVEVPGSAEPQPPAEQDFWLEQANGTGLQEIPLASQSGDFRLVVMNAAGSRSLVVDVYGSMTLPFLLPIGIGMLATGLLLLALGVGLLVWGIRSKPAPVGAPAQNPYPPTAGPSYHPGDGPYGAPGQQPWVGPERPGAAGPPPPAGGPPGPQGPPAGPPTSTGNTSS